MFGEQSLMWIAYGLAARIECKTEARDVIRNGFAKVGALSVVVGSLEPSDSVVLLEKVVLVLSVEVSSSVDVLLVLSVVVSSFSDPVVDVVVVVTISNLK